MQRVSELTITISPNKGQTWAEQNTTKATRFLTGFPTFSEGLDAVYPWRDEEVGGEHMDELNTQEQTKIK